MELPDVLILERYRLAIDRQKYYTSVARDAFATYAKFVAGIAAVIAGLLAARESLGLDATIMPDLIAMFGYVLAFLAAAAIVQIVVALVRWRRARAIEAELNPETPALGVFWWASEGMYIAIVVASVIGGWRVLGGLVRRA